MATPSYNPYAIDPALFIQAAGQLMQPQVQPTFAQATPGGLLGSPAVTLPAQGSLPYAAPRANYYGPTHQALSSALQAQLLQSLGVPGLLSLMQNDPSVAAQVGGLFNSSYTPPHPDPYRLSFANQTPNMGGSDLSGINSY